MNYKHGLRNSPEYRVWSNMKDRCFRKTTKNFADYGGRDITVCNRWKNSFANFIKDMGLRPSANHSLDRIDNDGNYQPDNCKWSTRMEQNKNKRPYKTNQFGISGVYKIQTSKTAIPKWRVTLSRNKTKIHLGYFNNLLDAACARKSAENRHQ